MCLCVYVFRFSADRANRLTNEKASVIAGILLVYVCDFFFSTLWPGACMVNTSLSLHSYVSRGFLDPLRPSYGIQFKSQRTRRCWGALLPEHFGVRVHPSRPPERRYGWLVALRRNLREQPRHMPVFGVVSPRRLCIRFQAPFREASIRQRSSPRAHLCHILQLWNRLPIRQRTGWVVRCRSPAVAAVDRGLEKPRRAKGSRCE